MKLNMLDIVNNVIEARDKQLTYDEWCEIRRNGTPEEISEAVERMERQGGYENLV